MSDPPGPLGLRAAQPAGCGRGPQEEQERAEVSGGLEGPELWSKDLGVQERDLELHSDGPAPVTRAPPPPPPPPPLSMSSGPAPVPSAPLANGVRMSRRPGAQGARRRGQLLEELFPPRDVQGSPAETARGAPALAEPGAPQAASQAPQDDARGAEQVQTGAAPEVPRPTSPPPPPPPRPPLPPLINHPVGAADQQAPFDLSAAREFPSTLSPVPLGPGPPADPPSSSTPSSALPVEAERKYALRSSGRPRFPCHLRKSSRIRRSAEDGDRRGRKEKEPEEGVGEEGPPGDKLLLVKEEAAAVGGAKALPSAGGAVPTAPCPPAHQQPPLAAPPAAAAIAAAAKPVPRAAPRSKPGPKLGAKPGGARPSPKSARRPGPKSVQRAAPHAAASNRAAAHAPAAFPYAPGFSGPPPPAAVRKEEPVEVEVTPGNKCRRGRFVGVRRIVVKVARIPVNLSRRQKSYKISNLETAGGPEKACEGVFEGLDPVREPTALLRMKNNGKSVMVMFPPGELPVILKRRRGRPPKQAQAPPPGGAPGEPAGAAVAGGNPDQPKKPRRRRRTKLPCPFPSYVNDTNDVKTEYGDVLSKLAFLNRQPPTTGRCSPPRCWTPSEPESFHVPPENPGISTLLHRLTGFRRRGGRGAGAGRGGGAAGGGAGAGGGGGDFNKSTFSDFFESIGKKRKLGTLSEAGPPRKRGKGANAGGGVGRGGGIVGGQLGGGDKPARKRRSRKNGALKGEAGGAAGQDWGNGAWGEEGGVEREKGGGAYQACGSPRGGFSSCEGGRGGGGGGGAFAGGRGAGPAGAGAEGPQGLFAGYFRSLLDSDDSSDPFASAQRESRKAASTPGYEPSSPVPGPSWSPAFPKRSPKTMGSAGEGPPQAQPPSGRTPYTYNNLAQTSPTMSCYPKSAPPSLSLSHSPSSPHPSSYGSYSAGFCAASPSGGGGVLQRPLDCSFSLGPGQNSGKAQMGYSGFQLSAKRGFSGYPGTGQASGARAELAGPVSPGGGFMSVAKCSPFSSSLSPEAYRHYNSSQWSYRQGYGGWAADSFGSQFHNYSEYGSNESKDILDISNYTPQKAKRQPFPESLSESSSDSSHLSSAATGSGPSSGCGSYKQRDAAPLCAEGGQSSLSSLEKLMMDWHESAAGPSYNWSQNVLFQSAGGGKQGRGRRKRAEPHAEKDRAAAAAGLPPDSPSIPSPTPPPKRGGAGGRPRGSRGGRGGLSPCQRERPSGAKGRARSASALMGAGAPEGPELFQEGPDYYSGDSSSLSPLATPTPTPSSAATASGPAPYLQDPSEYPSPYSAHPSTPSSEERYPALYPGESSSSLSPSISSPPYPPKPTPPPPAQTFHPGPSRTFSPSCSPAPRGAPPHGGTALSPPHRAPPKEPQYSQYDSPSYCSSPFWYGQSSHSGSLSPQTHPGTSAAAAHPHPNANPLPNPTHMSPHRLTQLNPGAHAHGHGHAHAHAAHNTHHHQHANHPNANLSPHAGAQQQQQLHPGSHLHPTPHAHPAQHASSGGGGGGGGGASSNNNNSSSSSSNNSNQPQNHPHHSNPHLHPHHTPHSSPGLHPHPHPHPTSMGFEDRHPPSSPMASHKRELGGQQQQQMNAGHHQGPLPHSPYHKPPALDSSSPHHQEDLVGGYPLPHHPYQGQRYVAQTTRGGGMLCQLLEPAADEGFSVTSL